MGQKRYGNPAIATRFARSDFHLIKGESARRNVTKAEMIRAIVTQWIQDGIRAQSVDVDSAVQSIGPAIPASKRAWEGTGKAESISVRMDMDERRKASSSVQGVTHKD